MKVPKRVVIPGIVIVVLVGLTAVGYHLVNGAASGTVEVKPVAQATATVKATQLSQAGQYASFDYPSTFVRVASNPAIAPTLTTYDYTRSQGSSASLDIGIYRLPSGNLNDDSSYHYRKTFPNQYNFSNQTVHGQNVPLATDKTLGYYNEVAYLQHGSYDATISLESASNIDPDVLAATLTDVLTSWQWQ